MDNENEAIDKSDQLLQVLLVLRKSMFVLAAAYGALSLTLLQALITAAPSNIYPKLLTHIWASVLAAGVALGVGAVTGFASYNGKRRPHMGFTLTAAGFMAYLWFWTFFRLIPGGLENIAEGKNLDPLQLPTLGEVLLQGVEQTLALFGF